MVEPGESTPHETASIYELFFDYLNQEGKNDEQKNIIMEKMKSIDMESILDAACLIDIYLQTSENNKEKYRKFSDLIACYDEKMRDERNLIQTLFSHVDLESLESLEIIPSSKAYMQKMVRLKTKLFYKQQKFNLLREESEGFAKLIVQLLQTYHYEPQHQLNKSTTVIMGGHVRLKDTISQLIGYFNLDPCRVLDVILEIFALRVTDAKIVPLFCNLIKSYWNDETVLLQLLIFRFNCLHNKNVPAPRNLFLMVAHLIINGIINLQNIYQFLCPDEETLRNQARIRAADIKSFCRRLTPARIRDLEEARDTSRDATFLSPSSAYRLAPPTTSQNMGGDSTTLSLEERFRALEASVSSTGVLMNVPSSSSSHDHGRGDKSSTRGDYHSSKTNEESSHRSAAKTGDASSNKQASRDANQSPSSTAADNTDLNVDYDEEATCSNHKLGLVRALAQLGAWHEIWHVIVSRGQWEYLYILSDPFTCSHLRTLLRVGYLTPLYQHKCCNNPVMYNKAYPHSTTIVWPGPPIKPVTDLNTFLARYSSLLFFLGPHIYENGMNAMLVHQLVRVVEHALVSPANAAKWTQIKLAEKDTLYGNIVRIFQHCLLPALSQSSCDCVLSESIGRAIKHLHYQHRYKLYSDWMREDKLSAVNLENDAYVIHWAPVITSKIITRVKSKYIMRRLSKDNVKHMGRQIGKLSHSNPGVMFQHVLYQIQYYENLIAPVIDTLRYITPLSFDVLMFCLIESLCTNLTSIQMSDNEMNPQSIKSSSDIKPNLPSITDAPHSTNNNSSDALLTDNTNSTSIMMDQDAWFANACAFAGSLVKKYPICDVTGLLYFAVNGLKFASVLLAGTNTPTLTPTDFEKGILRGSDLLLVVKELVHKMSGIEMNDITSTKEQLEALSGGDLLRSEAGYFAQIRNTKRSSQRLKESLLNSDILIPLALLIAQQRDCEIYHTASFINTNTSSKSMVMKSYLNTAHTNSPQESKTADAFSEELEQQNVTQDTLNDEENNTTPKIVGISMTNDQNQTENENNSQSTTKENLITPAMTSGTGGLVEASDHIKLLGRLYDQAQDALVQYVTFIACNFSVDEYVHLLPSLSQLINEYHLAFDAAFFIRRHSLSLTLKDTKYFGVLKNLLTEEAENVTLLMAPKVWTDITPLFFVTFWTFSRYDINYPAQAYNREISKLKQTIAILDDMNHHHNSSSNNINNLGNSLNMMSSSNSSRTNTPPSHLLTGSFRDLSTPMKRKKEKEKLHSLIDKLREEENTQKEHVKSLHEIFEQLKSGWFYQHAARNDAITQFLQKCIFSRATFSVSDAMYCAEFIKLLHKLKVPHFATLICLDRIFCDITYIMISLTENEAARYGIFLNSLMETALKWHSNAEIYNKECVGYPGFNVVKNTGNATCVTPSTTKPTNSSTNNSNDKNVSNVVNNETNENSNNFNTNNNNNLNNYLSYQDFRHVCHKWHFKMTKSVVQCLESGHYASIRNSLIVLTKLLPSYPIVANLGSALERRIEKIKSEEREKRADLYVLALSYSGYLKQKKSKFLPEHEFHAKDNVPMVSSSGAPTTGSTNSNTLSTSTISIGASKSLLSTPSTMSSSTITHPKEQNSQTPSSLTNITAKDLSTTNTSISNNNSGNSKAQSANHAENSTLSLTSPKHIIKSSNTLSNSPAHSTHHHVDTNKYVVSSANNVILSSAPSVTTVSRDQDGSFLGGGDDKHRSPLTKTGIKTRTVSSEADVTKSLSHTTGQMAKTVGHKSNTLDTTTSSSSSSRDATKKSMLNTINNILTSPNSNNHDFLNPISNDKNVKPLSSKCENTSKVEDGTKERVKRHRHHHGNGHSSATSSHKSRGDREKRHRKSSTPRGHVNRSDNSELKDRLSGKDHPMATNFDSPHTHIHGDEHYKSPKTNENTNIHNEKRSRKSLRTSQFNDNISSSTAGNVTDNLDATISSTKSQSSRVCHHHRMTNKILDTSISMTPKSSSHSKSNHGEKIILKNTSDNSIKRKHYHSTKVHKRHSVKKSSRDKTTMERSDGENNNIDDVDMVVEKTHKSSKKRKKERELRKRALLTHPAAATKISLNDTNQTSPQSRLTSPTNTNTYNNINTNINNTVMTQQKYMASTSSFEENGGPISNSLTNDEEKSIRLTTPLTTTVVVGMEHENLQSPNQITVNTNANYLKMPPTRSYHSKKSTTLRNNAINAVSVEETHKNTNDDIKDFSGNEPILLRSRKKSLQQGSINQKKRDYDDDPLGNRTSLVRKKASSVEDISSADEEHLAVMTTTATIANTGQTSSLNQKSPRCSTHMSATATKHGPTTKAILQPLKDNNDIDVDNRQSSNTTSTTLSNATDAPHDKGLSVIRKYATTNFIGQLLQSSSSDNKQQQTDDSLNDSNVLPISTPSTTKTPGGGSKIIRLKSSVPSDGSNNNYTLKSPNNLSTSQYNNNENRIVTSRHASYGRPPIGMFNTNVSNNISTQNRVVGRAPFYRSSNLALYNNRRRQQHIYHVQLPNNKH